MTELTRKSQQQQAISKVFPGANSSTLPPKDIKENLLSFAEAGTEGGKEGGRQG